MKTSVSFFAFFTILLVVISFSPSCSPSIGGLDLQPLCFILVDGTGRNVSKDYYNNSLRIVYNLNNAEIALNDVKLYDVQTNYGVVIGSHSMMPTAFEKNIQEFTLYASNTKIGQITLKVKKEERGFVPSVVAWNNTTISLQRYTDTGVEFGYILKL